MVLFGMATTADAAPMAAVHDVSITGGGFSPSSITINVGDSIRFTNDDPVAQHGAFDTGTIPAKQSGQPAQSRTTSAFSSPQSATSYLCSVHGNGMPGGTLTVVGSTTPAPVPSTPAPTASPTPAPTAQPTPQPTPVPTVAPTVAPTPVPTAAPTA
ncbi:MAG: hypothetical protein AAB295_00860, partial [Chloroflexota bacterium]